MANRYYCGIHECNACASSENLQVQEKHQLEEHAVVGHGRRKIIYQNAFNIREIIMFEVAVTAEVKKKKDCHNFTI